MELKIKQTIEVFEGGTKIDSIIKNDLFLGNSTPQSIRKSIRFVKTFYKGETDGFELELKELIKPDSLELVSYISISYCDSNGLPKYFNFLGNSSILCSSLELRGLTSGFSDTPIITNLENPVEGVSYTLTILIMLKNSL